MPERQEDLDSAPGIAHALSVLRERIWVIALCAIVALAAAIVYVERKPNQYTATAALQFTTNSVPNQVAGVDTGQSIDPEGEKNTNVQLVTSTAVASGVIRALNLRMSPAELLDDVTASDPQNDYIVDVAVTNEDPASAAKIANAFTREYVEYSKRENEEQLIKAQAVIAEKEAALPATDTAGREELNQLSHKMLALQAVAAANARVINTATAPGSPSSPNRKATAIVALVFGLLLGVGLAVLLHVLSRRINSVEDFERFYGLRALSGIPKIVRPPRTRDERDRAMEPYRILRNSLGIVARSDEVKTVLVSSAVPGEGKTSVATGLARTAALSGERVVLVEADLRRPTFAERLRVDGSADGLTAALLDGVDPLELLQQPFPEVPRLRVLPAGPVRADAASRLRPFELTRVFDALASTADLIVIDSAPLLPVVDTRVLLDELGVDVPLIVVRVGVTTRDDAKAVRTLLEQRRLTRGTGLVVNALSDRGLNYYYIADEQGGSSTAAEVEESPAGYLDVTPLEAEVAAATPRGAPQSPQPSRRPSAAKSQRSKRQRRPPRPR